MEDVLAHGDPSQQIVRLSEVSPARFDFSIEIIDELIRFTRDPKAAALGLLNDALESFLIETILLLCPLPLFDKLFRATANRFKVTVEEIGASLEWQAMGVEETGSAFDNVGLRVREDFELPWEEFEARIFQEAGEGDRQFPGALVLGEGEVEVQTAAVGTGAVEGGNESEGFQSGEDAPDRVGVLVGVVATVEVEVEEGVLGLSAEANAVEVAALLDEAIGEGVAGFGEPVGGVAGVGVVGVDIVETMGEEG
jgi:hypothetical protein